MFAGSDLGLLFWSPVGVQLESSWDLLESVLSPFRVLLNLFWISGVCCFLDPIGVKFESILDPLKSALSPLGVL